MRNVAVILAGGMGQRSGFTKPKQLVKLAGRPVMLHTLEKFQTHPDISEISIVSENGLIHEIEDLVTKYKISKVSKVLVGGAERYHSSLSAIGAYSSEPDLANLRLLFHDAVRPLVDHNTITEVISALDHYGAVDTGIPSPDTVLRINESTNTISEIPERSAVRLGQTPQGFRYEVIRDAYARAMKDVAFRTTDDCGVVLRYAPEFPIYVVPGKPANLKLTYANDLLLLDKYIQAGAGSRVEVNGEMISLSRLRGKSIVIFGGTSGIGSSMAQLAGAFGADVTVAGKSTGVDISNYQDVADVIESARASYNRVDCVINTAAILIRKPLSNMAPEEINESINVNIIGALNIARLSYTCLEAARGHLLMFASSSYTYGRAYYSTYSASKAAIVNLTQALADEWQDFGIKVNCVNPERTQTPMRTRAFGLEDESTLLHPDYVARQALYILTGETTGVIYDINKA